MNKYPFLYEFYLNTLHWGETQVDFDTFVAEELPFLQDMYQTWLAGATEVEDEIEKAQ